MTVLSAVHVIPTTLKDMTLQDEFPRSVGAQYATGEG